MKYPWCTELFMILYALFYLIPADSEEFKDANAGGWRAMGTGTLHCYHNS